MMRGDPFSSTVGYWRPVTGGRLLPRECVEPFDQIPRDRSRLAIPDGAAIDLDHRDHLGGSACQKAFIRRKHIVTG